MHEYMIYGSTKAGDCEGNLVILGIIEATNPKEALARWLNANDTGDSFKVQLPRMTDENVTVVRIGKRHYFVAPLEKYG